MELHTERLIIRYFRASDLQQYRNLVADPDVMQFLGGPQTKEVAEAYIDEMLDHHVTTGLGRYAVQWKSDQALIGMCGYRPAGKFIDLGYRYATSVWRQGVGLEAAQAVREYGLQTLKLSNIEIVVAQENKASVHIAEKLDFTYREESYQHGYDVFVYRDQKVTKFK